MTDSSGSVREAWGRYAPAFASEGAGAEDRESLRRLVELCRLPAGAVVCDVASGAGFTGFAFARTGCRVVLTDPTHEMLLAGRAGWA
ncbi:MAG: class I SAM-dependent methyltransferase, partial [Actinomycetota bacterium]